MVKHGKRSVLVVFTALVAGLAFGQVVLADPPKGEVVLTGTVSTVHVDLDSQRSETRHYLHPSGKGKRPLRLRLKKGQSIAAGKVRVRGRARGQEFDVEALRAEGEVSAAPAPDVAAAAPVFPRVSGDQQTIVLLVNFADVNVSSTVSSVRNLMFDAPNSIDAYYREVSYGAISFSGTVVGPFTISALSSSTDFYGWAAEADALATAAGIDLSPYTRIVYALPRSGLSAAGLGQVGGRLPSISWMFLEDEVVYAHELGHNLTLQHASTPASEYGDDSCAMGTPYGALPHLNAPHKVQLGWVPSADVTSVSVDGTHRVANLAQDLSEARVVRIDKPDTGEAYYVSFRNRSGIDAGLGSAYQDQVSIHRWGESSRYKTFLLATLSDSESFVDAANGISIQALSHDATHASVSVSFSAAPRRPTLTFEATPLLGCPDETTAFTLNLRNNDSVEVGTTTFDLTSTAPFGWTASFSPASLTIAPGATAQATLSVTPPRGVAAGTTVINVASSSAGIPQHDHAASCELEIGAPSAIAVVLTPPDRAAGAGSSQDYAIAITDGRPAGSATTTLGLSTVLPAGWSAVFAPDRVDVNPGETVAATLTVTSPGSALPGRQGFHVQASDLVFLSDDGSACASYEVLARVVPRVSLAPASRTGAPGSLEGYTVSVTNADALGEAATTFALSTNLPVGWTATLSPSSFALSPGQTALSTLYVTSPAGASSGSTTFFVRAGDTVDTTHAALVEGTYVVQVPAPPPPPPPPPSGGTTPSDPAPPATTPSTPATPTSAPSSASSDSDSDGGGCTLSARASAPGGGGAAFLLLILGGLLVRGRASEWNQLGPNLTVD